MTRILIGLFAGIVLIAAHVCGGDEPAIPKGGPEPIANTADGLPVGLWKVEFANQVVEKVELRRDGTAFVVEPSRSSAGKPIVRGGSVVIIFDDDRTERWSAVGKRFVVEHWCPASPLPTTAAILGIAERIE